MKKILNYNKINNGFWFRLFGHGLCVWFYRKNETLPLSYRLGLFKAYNLFGYKVTFEILTTRSHGK